MMFDSLQDGVMVICKEQMHFMNDLSNKILSKLTKVDNFLDTSKQSFEDPSIQDPMDAKIFLVFDTD